MQPKGRPGNWLFLVLPLLLLLGMNLWVDHVKPLGFDEMVVSRTALQPDLPALWKILVSGQSPHPPLNFLAVRAMYRVFGVTEISTRIPTTWGFTVMAICLFFFVSKRSNAAFGALAMLFPDFTIARHYSIEAKPYGALLGWTGIALICWRLAAPGNRRRGWALAGLGLALACATSSHFFGALLCVPIVAGEVVRSIERRKIDWPMAAVASLSFWPLVFFVPILQAGGRIHGVHPWQGQFGLSFIPRSFSLLLLEAGAPILTCLLVAAAFRVWSERPVHLSFPLDELAAAAALALLPVAAFCGLRLAGVKVIEEKYLITMVAGIAILFSWSLYSISGHARFAGSALVIVSMLWALHGYVDEIRYAQEERFESVNFSPPASAGQWSALPIVLDTANFVKFQHYASPPVAARIYYVTDPVVRQKYIGNDALDRSFLLNPEFFGPHVEPATKFDSEHTQFLFCEPLPEGRSWLLRKYIDGGAQVRLLNYGWNQNWYLVTR